MKGILIYQKEDYLKNKRFVTLFARAGANYQIEIEVLLTEEIEEVWMKRESLEERELPHFIVNRSRDASISEWFEKRGVRCFNRAFITDITNDKDRTYQYIRKFQIPFLEYKLNNELRDDETVDIDFPHVVKACKGHGGQEVFICHNREEENNHRANLKNKKYMIQKYAIQGNRDLRVYVIGKEVVISLLRTGKEELSNYSLGGKAEVVELPLDVKRYVERINRELDADFIGIDFILHDNKYYFNEIEDVVGSRMVYENTDIPIIEQFVEYIRNQLSSITH